MANLQTQRTLLRRFQLSDLQNMIRLESDPDIMKFTPSRVPLTVEKSEARLKSLIEKEAGSHPLGVWAVELKGSGEFVGWFMLIMTEFAVPEIGFMIVKDQWGKGLATEVAQALIDFGTKDLQYPGIAAVTDSENKKSIHILEKLGFEKKSSKTKRDLVLGKDFEAFIFELRSRRTT
jgi:RimJ/RimL family protein N-acetyltransferase